MKTMMYRRRKFFAIPLILIATAAFSGLAMVLWNHLMPIIFNLPIITFWQALGLLVLARLFFGGFGRHRGGGPMGRHMSREMRAKLKGMSAEERREFCVNMRRNRGAHFEPEFSEEQAAEKPDTQQGA